MRVHYIVIIYYVLTKLVTDNDVWMDLTLPINTFSANKNQNARISEGVNYAVLNKNDRISESVNYAVLNQSDRISESVNYAVLIKTYTL